MLLGFPQQQDARQHQGGGGERLPFERARALRVKRKAATQQRLARPHLMGLAEQCLPLQGTGLEAVVGAGADFLGTAKAGHGQCAPVAGPEQALPEYLAVGGKQPQRVQALRGQAEDHRDHRQA